jgi:hypothetical protein
LARAPARVCVCVCVCRCGAAPAARATRASCPPRVAVQPRLPSSGKHCAQHTRHALSSRAPPSPFQGLNGSSSCSRLLVGATSTPTLARSPAAGGACVRACVCARARACALVVVVQRAVWHVSRSRPARRKAWRTAGWARELLAGGRGGGGVRGGARVRRGPRRGGAPACVPHAPHLVGVLPRVKALGGQLVAKGAVQVHLVWSNAWVRRRGAGASWRGAACVRWCDAERAARLCLRHEHPAHPTTPHPAQPASLRSQPARG